MDFNVGTLDRVIRFVVGLGLMVAGVMLARTGVVSVIPGVIIILTGLMALVTATIRFCPLYLPLRISTVRRKREKRP